MSKYDIEFKKSIVALYQNGKSQTKLSREYGVSLSTIGKWIKQFSEVKIDNDTILSAKQIRELKKRNELLEEENLILKKPLPYSRLLKQRLDTVHTFLFQHSIKTLCRVLNINRSTYYKHFNPKPSNRSLENQKLNLLFYQFIFILKNV